MLETALAQIRLAFSVGFGQPFSLRSLDRLLAAMQETQEEFGALALKGEELVSGPPLDEATRRVVQLNRFRQQAWLAAKETDFYHKLFEESGLNPKSLNWDDIARLPLTSKEALRSAPDAFVCQNSKYLPFLRALTTGTTGRSTCICFSEHELKVYFALSALSYFTSGVITREDIVQISTSARGVLGNLCLAGGCARVGAQVYLAGVVEPAQALAMLCERRVLKGKHSRTSVLYTYPSYLGELVEEGLQMGYGPTDFGLRNIIVGGELVTEGLKLRSRKLFGEVQFIEGYGMTETWPLAGTLCEQNHLHFEPSQALVEIIDPDSLQPALPGKAGSIVATPFPPYRYTTLLLRYDTQDMVRTLDGVKPLNCSLKAWPATTPLLGKRSLAVQHADKGWTYPRQVLEALEVVEEVPLPARFGFWDCGGGGIAVEVVIRSSAIASLTRHKLWQSLESKEVPVREVRLVKHPDQLTCPYPLRCDLREYSFSAPRPVLVPELK